MVLSKPELVASFQNEARILNHLLTKIDHSKLDHRPAPAQRSTADLVKYLSMMGPTLVGVALAGTFDRPAWNAAEREAADQTFEDAVNRIAVHGDTYARLLAGVSDAELRDEIVIFGNKSTRGAVLVNLALCHCAAYRTQLFLYLKASGREELATSNLWFGADPAPAR